MDLQEIDVGSLQLPRPRSVGVVQVGLDAVTELGLLETRLFSTARTLPDLQETVTLYDLSNTCFECEAKVNRKARLSVRSRNAATVHW